jgi:hypothetical protein
VNDSRHIELPKSGKNLCIQQTAGLLIHCQCKRQCARMLFAFSQRSSCTLLRLAWRRSSHNGRDFALLPKEHFGFHGAAVRAFEAVDCKISANCMWPDHIEL